MNLQLSSDNDNYAVFKLTPNEVEILQYLLYTDTNIKKNFTVKESQTDFIVKSKNENYAHVSDFLSYINYAFNHRDLIDYLSEIRVKMRKLKIEKIKKGS